MPKLSCIDSTWNTATRPLILQHVKAGVQSPAWAFLGWQSLQQHQGAAPGRESLVPHPRHIWFWAFWVFHIVYHMEYVFIYTILVYIGIFSVWIHISPWQRQGIEGSARGILEINPLWQREKGDAVWWKSRNHPSFRLLCSFQFVCLCYRSTRVFSGQDGPCLSKSSSLFHYFSGLLAWGSYYISFASKWAGGSKSVV